MKYEVTFTVLTNYTTVVEASSEQEAKKLAREVYSTSSLGDFEYADELDVRVEPLS